MKRLWRVLLVLIVNAAIAQNAAAGKPCIAFSSNSDSASNANLLAKEALSTAVTLSGDFQFYESPHQGCWTVHVISLPMSNEARMPIGYAVSYTVTDPNEIELDHVLLVAPDNSVFERAMRQAAVSAIKSVRLWERLMESKPKSQMK